MRKQALVICAALLLMYLNACAGGVKQEGVAPVGPQPQPDAMKPVRVSAEDADAAEPTVASAPDGTAYVTWVEHRENKEADVMLARVGEDGKATAPPVRVNPTAGSATAWRGDAPTLAVAPDGAVYVGWTARAAEAGKHANELYLSTSRDGGKTFEPPVKVNDDGKAVEHGMHSLAVGSDGRVYVAWLDERNVVKPAPAATDKAGGMKMEHMEANREVFVAVSADGGRTFSANQRIAKEACPCCKTSVAAGEGGRVFVGWRQVLPGEFRHIGVAASLDGGKTFNAPVIVSDDRWMIAACPVSGPALAVAGDGALRVVWYTEGDKGAHGLYWAESRDDGRTFSEGRALAKGEARGTPLLLANGKMAATAVWESNEGSSPRVMGVTLDGGQPAPFPLANGGELPSAAFSRDQLLVGYIAKINDRRSIWVVRAKPVG